MSKALRNKENIWFQMWPKEARFVLRVKDKCVKTQKGLQRYNEGINSSSKLKTAHHCYKIQTRDLCFL
jgi:hypothetical protein